MDVVTLAAAKANAAKQIEEAMQGGGAVAGKSAYEIAVDEGFSGTEEEWIASLHGADGSNGYNPTIVEKTSTDDEYVLTVTYKDGSGTVQSYDTPNLKGSSGSSGSSGGTVIAEVTGDGSTTVSALLDSLYAQVQAKGGLDEKKNYKLLWYYSSSNSYDVMTLYNFAKNEKIEFVTFWQGTNEIRSDNYVLKSSGSTKTKQTSKDSNSTTDKSSDILPSGDKYTIIEYGGGGAGSAGYEVLAESQSGDTYAEALARFKTILSAMSDEEVVNTALIDSYDNNGIVLLTFNERDDGYIQYSSVEGNSSNVTIYKYRIWLNGNTGADFAKHVSHPDSGATPNVADLSSNTVVSLKLVRLAGGASSSGASSEEIGDLEDLTTSAKTDLVSAINEVNNLANGERIELVEPGTDTTFSAQIDKFYTELVKLTDEQLLNAFILYNGSVVYRFNNNDGTTSYDFGCISYGSDVTQVYADHVRVMQTGSKFMTNNLKAGTSTDFTSDSMGTDTMGLYVQASQTTVRTPETEVLASVTADGVKTASALFDELYAEIVDKISIEDDVHLIIYSDEEYNLKLNFISNDKSSISFVTDYLGNSNINRYFEHVSMRQSGSECVSTSIKSDKTVTVGTWSSSILLSGEVYKVIRKHGGSSSHKVLGTVTSDGVKTCAALLKDLWDACVANGGFDAQKKYELRFWFSETTNCFTLHQSFFADDAISFTNSGTNLDSASHYFTINTVQISSTAAKNIWENITQKTNGQTYANNSSSVQSAGTRFEVIEV